ncbi:hypothetical protein [Brenneria izbisi]|uniref:site-specific DNA-methyltransferase (adenine-specific) n=1 Tax=Brenneria izbisi TaxID=2939450 RepID=A0AA41XYU6_9GAMM|nr:hypothetical protein [Brenneria izbisi]MCV9879227.1 hypothetical protein [Brenneria izbisi]MCV9882739.1 hypothetical protein [Brenneria izbisi]
MRNKKGVKVKQQLRPFFPYYGSKWNMARYYLEPKHNIVIEPFAGSAGYSTYYACDKVHLVDLDPVITGVWSYLIKAKPSEIMALPELPEVGDSVDDFNLCEEQKWLIGFWLNRGSAVPKKSRTAYSARNDRAQLNWGPKAKERIASQLFAIENWKVSNCSYHELNNTSATWFIDPPYVDKGKYYRKKISDYEHLANWCLTREGSIIVCEGNEADWLPFEPMGSFKTSLGRAKEMVFKKTESD